MVRTSLTLVAALALGARSAADEQPRGVLVGGSASSAVAPDRAVFSAGVGAQAGSPTAASKAAAAAMVKVFAVLDEFKVAKADRKTTGYQLSPVYAYPQGAEPVLRGYSCVNQVEVTFRDLGRLPALVEALADAGADRLGRVSFQGDTKAAYRAALQAAVADAREKADLLAAASGAAVGPVVSVVETSYNDYDNDAVRPQAVGIERAAAPPLAPGERKVRVQVQVRYALAAPAAGR